MYVLGFVIMHRRSIHLRSMTRRVGTTCGGPHARSQVGKDQAEYHWEE
jgi:hypothetical protein